MPRTAPRCNKNTVSLSPLQRNVTSGESNSEQKLMSFTIPWIKGIAYKMVYEVYFKHVYLDGLISAQCLYQD